MASLRAFPALSRRHGYTFFLYFSFQIYDVAECPPPRVLLQSFGFHDHKDFRVQVPLPPLRRLGFLTREPEVPEALACP